MKRIFARIFMFFSGWASYYPSDLQLDKSVMIAAPHTSNWDFMYAISFFWIKKIPIRFFIKDSYTKGFFGPVLKHLGAIGVDRAASANLVHYAAAIMEKQDKMMLLVPVEGTRKKVEKWKTGFYYIAKKAKVPVSLGYLDYNNRIAGVGQIIHLSDDFDKDMAKIEAFYQPIKGKHPELFNKKIY